MALLVVALFGSAVAGNYANSFLKLRVGPISVFGLIILGTLVTYAADIALRRSGRLPTLRPFPEDGWLWGFFFVGCGIAMLSYAGVYRALPFDTDIAYDKSYVPRQAYYLFFIPLIILAGRDPRSKLVVDFIGTHRTSLFIGIYLGHIILARSFDISLQCCFVLCVLLLMGAEKRRIIDLLLLGILALSGVSSGSTQLIITVIAVLAYARLHPKRLLRIGTVVLLCVVGLCYLMPLLPVDELFGFDANTLWRARYWVDELTQLSKTYLIGVGYGTAYASYAWAGEATNPAGPFKATEMYSATEKLFVVGCHNSFVALFFRLGIAGIIPLLMYIYSQSKTTRLLTGIHRVAAAYAVVASLVIVCFNVGFESPGLFFCFAFAYAFLCTQRSDYQTNSSRATYVNDGKGF